MAFDSHENVISNEEQGAYRYTYIYYAIKYTYNHTYERNWYFNK